MACSIDKYYSEINKTMNIDIIFLIYYYKCGSDTINSSTLKITWLKALEIKNLSCKLIWSINNSISRFSFNNVINIKEL